MGVLWGGLDVRRLEAARLGPRHGELGEVGGEPGLPRTQGRQGHEVGLVHEEDGGFALAAAGEVVEGEGEVKEGAAGVDEDDEGVAPFRDAPNLTPVFEVALEVGHPLAAVGSQPVEPTRERLLLSRLQLFRGPIFPPPVWSLRECGREIAAQRQRHCSYDSCASGHLLLSYHGDI